ISCLITKNGAVANQTCDKTVSVNANVTTTDPSDAAVCQGTDANFSTTASGTGPFHYAWKLDGNAIGSDSPNLTVPTGSLSASTHPVTVHVTGTCGSADQSADLVVQANTATTDPS